MRYTTEEIKGFVAEMESGVKAKDIKMKSGVGLQTIYGWKKKYGSKAEPVMAAPASDDGPSSPVSDFKDELDVKFEYFKYTKSEHDLDVWEHDSTGAVNATTLPPDIRRRYPDMRFHYGSLTKLKALGVGYQGWQIFKDGKYPEGKKIGNDLVLMTMPEERAQRYNNRCREESNERMAGLAEQNIVSREAAASNELKQRGYTVEPFGTGVSVDTSVRSRVTPRRGLHPDEIKERIIKNREKIARSRVFFT